MPWEKQFDRDVVLERAVQVFWKRGYDASSMDVLLKGMGIQKGSFYATFTSKHQLFIEALNRYVEQRFKGFGTLARQRSPLSSLRRHLDGVVKESTGSKRFMGCLLVNCALELAPRDKAVRDIVERSLEAHAGIYRSLLEEAKAVGELPARFNTKAAAAGLLGLVLGMRVKARGGMSAAAIASLREHAESIIAG